MKAAIFHPAARREIRSFPPDVRRELGKAIFDLQRGESLGMPLSRPMPAVAPGVEEIRIRDRAGNYRVFCYAPSEQGVLVLHAFMKKTQATPSQNLQLARRRLTELTHAEK
jgi:phage-related protein